MMSRAKLKLALAITVTGVIPAASTGAALHYARAGPTAPSPTPPTPPSLPFPPP